MDSLIKNIVAICIFLIAATSSKARIITVDDNAPADFNNIQAAINDAINGDTVEIQAGRYMGPGNRDIDFKGKAITVRSTDPNDPNMVTTTIIDCNGTEEEPHRGFYFHSGEELDSILAGLTIMNGYGPDQTSRWETDSYGGAVYCNGASPRLTRCIITMNSAGAGGGGINCYNGSDAAIEYCTVTGNTAKTGAGIRCEFNSNPTIANCHILHNVAQNNGGGIVCYLDSSPVIANCLIMYNAADSGNGGAIMCMESSDATIVNSLIARNVAGQACGGIQCRDSSPHILNCTVTANTAPMYGGGIECLDGNPRITNCVVWGNVDQTFRAWDSTLEISHSVIEGGQEAVSVDGRTVLLWQGVIDTDPEFVDPNRDDFRLQTGSYCTDSGTNVSFPAFASNDLDGYPRLIDGDNDTHAVVDMGAYESLPADEPHIKLSAWELEFFTEADGPNPSSQMLEIRNGYGDPKNWVIAHDCNWLDASPGAGLTTVTDQVTISIDSSALSPGVHTCELRVLSPDAVNSPRTLSVIVHILAKQLRVPQHTSSIQQAIDHTLENGSVIIEPGTYTGPGNRNINFRGKAITVRSTDPNDPNVVANTIIDCNASSWYPRRGFRFVTNEGPELVLAGLTIINGLAIAEEGSRAPGGGIYGYEASPTITDCIIANNSTPHYSKGGGIYFANASPHIRNCLIRANTATNYGGGLGFDNSTPTISNCIITANTADYGAGIGTHDGHPTITNCTIVANIADGIYCANANIANCIAVLYDFIFVL